MALAFPPNKLWLPEDLDALPDDGNRYEVIDGELLVTPAPSFDHQDVALALIARLSPYVRRHALGRAIIAPADVQLDRRARVQPDVFVAVDEARKRPRRSADVRHLRLAAEVVSPSSARSDRGKKRRLYQRWRADEYWIVDVDARLVERWRPEDERPEVVSGAIEWRPEPAPESLRIDLDALFAEALDE
ncbi:MAG TPA: Uma2 family endonuclease [Gemmatimonadaceae bacterium]|nr:Uma2 family endonuclease [Gemmatimonadaceae bacterium]